MSYSGTIVAEYGGFWRRVGAALLDGIIINIISFILGAMIGFGFAVGGGSDPQMVETVAGLAGFVGGLVYVGAMTSSSSQATLGEMALGLQVVRLDGAPIGFWRAILREASKWISALILMIGFLMVAFTERKQGLHDKMVGTLVVKKGTLSQSSVF